MRCGYIKAIFCVSHVVLPYSNEWDDQTNWNFFLQNFEALVLENTNTFVLFCTRLLRLQLKTYLNTLSLSPIKTVYFLLEKKLLLFFSTKVIFYKTANKAAPNLASNIQLEILFSNALLVFVKKEKTKANLANRRVHTHDFAPIISSLFWLHSIAFRRAKNLYLNGIFTFAGLFCWRALQRRPPWGERIMSARLLAFVHRGNSLKKMRQLLKKWSISWHVPYTTIKCEVICVDYF